MAKELLTFYATKYSKKKGIDHWAVGVGEHFDTFYNLVYDNPLLLKYFGTALPEYIKKEYDGLPF